MSTISIFGTLLWIFCFFLWFIFYKFYHPTAISIPDIVGRISLFILTVTGVAFSFLAIGFVIAGIGFLFIAPVAELIHWHWFLKFLRIA